MHVSENTVAPEVCTWFAYANRSFYTCVARGIVAGGLTSFTDTEIGFSLSSNCFLPPHTNANSAWLVPPQKVLCASFSLTPLQFGVPPQQSWQPFLDCTCWVFFSTCAGSPSLVRNSPHLAYIDTWILRFYPDRWHRFGMDLNGIRWCPFHSEVLCSPSNTHSGKSLLCLRTSQHVHTDCYLLQER